MMGAVIIPILGIRKARLIKVGVTGSKSQTQKVVEPGFEPLKQELPSG